MANVTKIIGGLGKVSEHLLADGEEAVTAAQRAEAGRKAAALIKTQPQVKASEALGQQMEKGMKRTTTTQADRTRVGGGNIGGAPFSAISEADPAYAGKVWGVMDEGTAARLKNLTDDETAWTTMLGSANQLKTNPIVFDKLKRQFIDSMKQGNLSPELEAKINHNLALNFGEGASIRDPKIWREANTFEKRAALADVMMGQGITPKKGGVALGGEKSGKGVIFRPTDTIKRETEPSLLHTEHGGDVPTFAAGPRLFKLEKESVYRPDLHPGFPTMLTGKDLEVNMIPTPTEVYLPEWHKKFKKDNPERYPPFKTEKQAGPGYYDLALGVKGEGLPSQDLNDEYIRHLLREGFKKGGEVRKHGHSFEEDLAAAFAEVIAEHNPKPMHGEITVKTSAPVKMGVGGVITKAMREANLAKFMEDSVAPKLYHGTRVLPDSPHGIGDIQTFDRLFTTKFRKPSIDTMGHWLSTNPGKGGAEMYSGASEGSAIYPVHASIKHPYYTTFQDMAKHAREYHNGVDDGRMIGEPEVDAYRKWLASRGIDGVVIRHDKLNPGGNEFKEQDAWIALHPNQIKSATGNRGTYDINENDISKAEGGLVHMGAGGKIVKGLIGAGRRLTSTERAASDAIGKAAESAGVNPPVMADKMYPPLTNLQDFRTSFMDNIREGAVKAKKEMDLFDYKYAPGQHVFTEHGAKNNLPPLKIMEKSRVGNAVVREDPNNPFSKSVIDPETGKSQRTPYEPGYLVRRQGTEGPEDWSEFLIPQTAIKGDVEMAKGGGLRMAMGGTVTADYNTVPDDNDGGAIIQNPSSFAKGGKASIMDALDRVSDEETIDHQIERYLNRVRLNGSGGKDAYGTNAGGRLGLDIPLSKDVTISPYLEGYAYKPTNQPIGGQVTGAGANLTMRFKDGGETRHNLDVAPRRNIDELHPIHMGYGGLAKRALRGLKGTNVAEGNKLNIIKDTGGNWLSGSVEEHLSPLRQTVRGATPSERIARYNQLLEAATDDASRALIQRDIDTAIREDALDRWVGGNLTKYVKNQMGTAEDPVRKLAEQNIIHTNPNAQGVIRQSADANRMRAGTSSPVSFDKDYSGVGRSALARGWEDLTDAAINPSTVADQVAIRGLFKPKSIPVPNHPDAWMAKADPDTKVYGFNDNWSASDFGYDHIMDVLREDIATGRILPENLNKMNMEHAVRRTYQYDQELAKRMREASTLAREGLPVLKEFPNGFRWLQLNKPGSFAAESDAMGHSARGYEPPKGHEDWVEGSGNAGTPSYGLGGWEAIKSGKAKMYSLVDKEGKSHATIEVKQSDKISPEQRADKISNLVKGLVGEGQTEENALRQATTLYPESESYSSINQIKPPGNYWTSEASMGRIADNPKYMEDIQPYLQDFVKTGKWSKVNDLENTGLIHRDGKYLTSAEDAEYLANELKPPLEGMAKGGLVHMAPGGLIGLGENVVKWASQLAKTINSHKMESMSGEQWMKWLNANAPKSAKKEALASGTLDWLPQQGKVSKSAIIEHMKANAPQIKTTKFVDNPKPGMQARFEELRNEGEVRRLTPSERDEIEELEQKLEDTPKTKFDEHVLPGGQNYREMTLSNSNPTAEDYIVPGAHTYRDNDADINRILHMRMNDRPYNGGNALHLEELQSDWAQRGRSSGFKKPVSVETSERLNKLEEVARSRQMTYPEMDELISLKRSLEKGLPSGPYVENTEDWTKLGLHNAIKEAAEQGHNAVTWTGGDAQANRWSNEGLKHYYDTVMPSVSNDILKNMGVAERVGEFDVGTGVPHQGFNITPEMLDYIKQNGMPRFQEGGQAHYNKAEQVVESTQELIDKFVEMYEKTSGKEPKPPKEVFRDPWHMKDGGAAPRRDVSELIPFSPHLPSAVSGGLDWVKGKVLDEAKTYSNPRAIPDVAANVASDWVGMPVDIAKILADVADYGGEKVARAITGRSSKKLSDLVKEDEHEKPTFGSSEYIKDYLKEKGITTGTERPISEFAAFPVAPALLRGATRTGKKYLNQPPHLTQQEYDDILSGQSPRKLRNVDELIPIHMGVGGNISKLKAYMLERQGTHGAQRVERAADEVPNLENMYQQQALRRAFGYDKQSAVAVINPADFEKYSSPLPSSGALQREIDEHVKHLRSVGQFSDVPYLNLHKPDIGEPIIPGYEEITKSRRTPRIVGHQGRHRGRALTANGEQSSLVIVSPMWDLKKHLKSKTHEEYLDELYKEMAKTDNMVRPETYEIDGADQHRPAIALPEMFSEGGVASKRNVNELHPLY